MEKKMKAVITVPEYFQSNEETFAIESIIESAKMADIEIIDIIEETHADLLYYLSKDEYVKQIKEGSKIAIIDIGGGTGFGKVYEILEHEGKKVALMKGFIECNCCGRSFDHKIIKGVLDIITERFGVDLMTLFQYRTFEEFEKEILKVENEGFKLVKCISKQEKSKMLQMALRISFKLFDLARNIKHNLSMTETHE